MSLKPWREVIIPHEDVLEGTFQDSEFAADLTKVVQGIATPDYQDPVRFFERTVITEGMGLLLQSVVKRLTGNGGDPVVQLQTAFGGGKTHTMMAVLHVARGAVGADKLLGVPEILKKAKIKELGKGNVAVLDGNSLSPSHPREHGKITAHTLWGELAWQLGREDGYARVAASDRDGTSPGKDILAKLFRDFGPVIVLLDETVAYLRQFEPGKTYAGGSYNSNLSFIQALTEAASQVPNAMILASLPESDVDNGKGVQVGDDRARQALKALETYFGRIEAVWKPVGTEEAFEIVRRRLFGKLSDESARDDVCNAFSAYYVENEEKLPPETRDAAYGRRLRACYPIHPEVFEHLYQDWSLLPTFQRTRGTLRLMARIIHSLWRDGDKDLLIQPASLPLHDSSVRNELIKHLPPGWDPIVDRDVDGQHAEPRNIDVANPSLGAMQAARRAARTIFLGSAASVSTQNVRGISIEDVRLGCAQPGQSIGKYDDAIRKLVEGLHHLYPGNNRFWYDLRANLRREMEGRMARFDVRGDLYPEIQERLSKTLKTDLLQAVHIFSEHKDVPDKPELRMVVIDPEHAHKRKDWSSRAIERASEILTKHGEKQREFQNRVLFLAADTTSVQALRDNTRRYLAWKSIHDDQYELNLDKHQEKETKKAVDEASARVDACIRETYKCLLVPTQDPDAPDGLTKIAWDDEALMTSSVPFEKALDSACRDRVFVVRAWAPIHLKGMLERWFWKPDAPAVNARRAWLDSCRYLYLQRLAGQEVFEQTVREGIVHTDFFAFASSMKPDGAIDGLLFGQSGSIYLDESGVLLRADVAAATKAAKGEAVMAAPPSAAAPLGASTATKAAEPKTGTAKFAPKRFHATVALDGSNPLGSFTQVFESVLEHFTAQFGTTFSISVDFEAKRSEGFDVKLVRTVRENAKTLAFNTAEFEEE